MFIYFLFPETAKRSIEELAFRLYLILASTIIYWRIVIVYEGDKMRAEQNRRIEQGMYEAHREEVLLSKPNEDKASNMHTEKA
jgi:hypothetical protein